MCDSCSSRLFSGENITCFGIGPPRAGPLAGINIEKCAACHFANTPCTVTKGKRKAETPSMLPEQHGNEGSTGDAGAKSQNLGTFVLGLQC